MQWTEDLSVGVARIDEQHRELFRRINGLVDAIKNAQCKYTIDSTIDFLAEYAATHFRQEEEVMEAAGYPGYAEHRAQHAIFLKALAGLRNQAAKPRRKGASYDLSVETNRVVVDWILAHIMRVDKKLGAYLRGEA